MAAQGCRSEAEATLGIQTTIAFNPKGVASDWRDATPLGLN
jgi:hypothetical protein